MKSDYNLFTINRIIGGFLQTNSISRKTDIEV